MVGQLPILAGYRAAEFFNEPVKSQNAHLGYVQQNLHFLTPIWRNSTNEINFTANVGVESFDTNAILPSTQQPFPADLWRVNFGPTYRHQFDNGWIGGGGMQLGSFSDKPFHSIDEMMISAEGFLRRPSKGNNAWIYSVAMSSNSPILPFIPIPGVAYFWAPSKSFQALLGFPFANATWRPTDDWTFNISYALINFNGRVSYQLCRKVRLFVGADTVTQNYFRADRAVNNYRLFEYYDQAFTGMQVILSPRAFFDLHGGYVFDRFFFEGRTFASGQDYNRVNIDPGAFVSATLQFRF